MIALLLAALLQQAPTDEEIDTLVKAFKAEYPKHGIDAHIAAIQELLKTVHEKTIRAVADPLKTDAEAVRLATTKELADIDHPASVEVLVGAISKNINRPEVMDAICDALGTLGWQSAAGPLHELLGRAADPDVRACLPSAIRALGLIGSTSSVEVLSNFLIVLDAPGRKSFPNEAALSKAADLSLRQITGFDFRKGQEWLTWWKTHGSELTPTVRKTYWLRNTQERVTVNPGGKVPDDAVLVSARLTEVPTAAVPAKKKKKGK